MTTKKKKPSTSIVHEGPGVWAGESAKYRAEDDHRTMTRAGEIKADRERMKAVKDHHKTITKNMDKVCK